MADIIRREERGVGPFMSAWEPFRLMREMMNWEPMREHGTFGLGTLGFQPCFDIRETEQAYEFEADLPGVREKDLHVTLAENRLTVSGNREREKKVKDEERITFERSHGSFSRSFTLPGGVDTDKLTAELKDGVLKLTVPKKPEVQAKEIQIKVK